MKTGILAFALLTLSVGEARPPQAAPALELVGLTGQRHQVTPAELAKLPHVEAMVSSHNVTGKYRGVPLGELLRLIDRPSGEAFRGKALAAAISVEAKDGYRVIFALAEVDTGFTNKVIFLADSKNGAALDSTEGPYRIIVPDEKRPARWSKWITRIRLIAVE
jgi:molybdopterin-dependent oxidoreductase-like protein protein